VTGPQLGVQMYTVDALAEQDYRGTLEKIAGLGYAGVETYRFHGHNPAEIRRMAEDLGLTISGAHAPFPAGAEAKHVLDDLAELGAPALTWSLEAEELVTCEAIERGAERVNLGASNAAAYGIEVAYHNHWAEFTNCFGDVPAYEVLWGFLDPNVLAEVDVYWVKVGGGEPSEVLRKLGARARFLHLRDGPADDPGSTMVAVGSGRLDMPAVIAASPEAHWYIVEMGATGSDVFDVLAESYRYLVAARQVGSTARDGATP
jgi:sugar phosphate isomerase/epimerase